jgi:NADH dehydrogenase
MITGASGYIGRRLVDTALARGLDVVAVVRDPKKVRSRAGLSVEPFDLAHPVDLDDALCGVDAVIHLAAIIAENSRPAGVDEDLNVSGTRRLLEAARRRGLRRFVFLSSQSAAVDSPTRYGRSKWDIEQLLTGTGECSVRTGLVSGGPPRGLYGVLFRLSKRLPCLPVVRPGAPVYPVHVSDLCTGLLSLVQDDGDPPRLTRIAATEPMNFGAYIRMLAIERLGRRIRLLPIPGRLILVLGRLTELVPFLPTVDGERVRGLMALRPMDAASIPAPPTAPVLRDVAGTLAEEGLRRRLLTEGRTLTRYVLGARVPSGVLRRYTRAVLADDDREPLALSSVAQACPALLRWSEPVGATGRLRKRLALATRIVEMTPQAAPVFHNYKGRPRLAVWIMLAWLIAIEALLLPFRLIRGRRR